MKRLSLSTLLCLSLVAQIAVAANDPTTGYPVVAATCTSVTGATCSAGTITRTVTGSGFQQSYAQLAPASAFGYTDMRIDTVSGKVYMAGFSNTGTYATDPANWTASGGEGSVRSHGQGPTFGVQWDGTDRFYVQQEEASRYFVAKTLTGITASATYRIHKAETVITLEKWNGSSWDSPVWTWGGGAVAVTGAVTPQISVFTAGAAIPVSIMQTPAWTTGNTYVRNASDGGSVYANGVDEAHATTPDQSTNNSRPIVPGTNVYFTCSTYPCTYAPITISNSGTPGNYITYRPLLIQNCVRHPTVDNGCSPTVKIDANGYPHVMVMNATGSYLKIWGFEGLNSDAVSPRTSGVGGSDISRGAQTTANAAGSYVEFSYNVLHDANLGLGRTGQQTGGNYHGNVIYGGGFVNTGGGPGSGYATYLQNPHCDVPISMKANFFGNAYTPYGWHLFSNESETIICSYTVDTGIGAQGSSLTVDKGNKSNLIFKNLAIYGGGPAIGNSNEINDGPVIVTDNFFDGGSMTLRRWPAGTQFKRNFVRPATNVNNAPMISVIPDSGYSGYDINNNTYLTSRLDVSTVFILKNAADGSPNSDNTFAQWKTKTGWDAASTFYNVTHPSSSAPPYLIRQIMPYPELLGWSLLAVYNYGASGTPAISVTIDLDADDKSPANSAGLVNGQAFKIVSLFSGKVLYSGTYTTSGHTFTLPMNTDDPQVPRIGNATVIASTPANPMPEFLAAQIVPGAQTLPNTPAGPTNMTVNLGTSTGITWTWVCNSNTGTDDDTGMIFGYQYSTDNGGSWSTLSETTLAAHATTRTIVPSPAKALYRAYVRAANSAGDSVGIGPVQSYSPTLFCYSNLPCVR